MLGTQPIPFSLTNETLITLAPNTMGGQDNPRDAFTGETTVFVTVVPQLPVALLVATGLSMLVGHGFRRRRATRMR